MKKTKEICGLRCLELYEKLNPGGLLGKMFLGSSTLPTSRRFAATWKARDTKCSRWSFRLRRLERLISDTDCLSWPTPTVQDGKNNAGPSQFRRHTLPLNAAVMLYPTPTAITNSGGAALCKWGGPGARAKLKRMVTPTELNGKLNPQWVEWLMGFPIGWTDLRPLETQLSHRLQSGLVG